MARGNQRDIDRKRADNRAKKNGKTKKNLESGNLVTEKEK